MGARRFGPDTARFLQRDNFNGATADLGLALDPLIQNRYALASGNPISFVEWDGHVVLADGGGGGAPSPSPSGGGDPVGDVVSSWAVRPGRSGTRCKAMPGSGNA